MAQPTGVFADGSKHVLGRGAVYFDRKDAAGLFTGERFLGNASAFEVTPAQETREVYGFVDQSNPLLQRAIVKSTLDVNMTLREYDAENFALALYGEKTTFSNGSGTLTDEQITGVKKGRWYKLSKMNLDSVTSVESLATGGTTYVAGTDYQVDLKVGRIYIEPAGAIADASNIFVTAPYSAYTPDVTHLGTTAKIEGFIRFVGDPMTGPAFNAELWKVVLGGDGAVGFIGEDYGEMRLKGAILSDANVAAHATNPFGRIWKLP